MVRNWTHRWKWQYDPEAWGFGVWCWKGDFQIFFGRWVFGRYEVEVTEEGV